MDFCTNTVFTQQSSTDSFHKQPRPTLSCKVPELRQEFRVHALVGTIEMECQSKTQPLKRPTLLPFLLKQIIL